MGYYPSAYIWVGVESSELSTALLEEADRRLGESPWEWHEKGFCIECQYAGETLAGFGINIVFADWDSTELNLREIGGKAIQAKILVKDILTRFGGDPSEVKLYLRANYS